MSCMKKITCIILCILYGSLYAQELSAVLIAELPLEAEQFVGVDEFDNMYYVNSNILYKKTTTKMFSYSNVELGKLYRVNILNPFKIILFYADFNAVMILDNNLNELTDRIDFTDGTLFNNVQFVSDASQNNLWLYADDNKLHLYDYQGLRELGQTQPLTFYDPDFTPVNLVSTYKKVWILSKKAVYEFNEYGAFMMKYDLLNVEQIFPFEKGFMYVSQGSFFYQESNANVPIKVEYRHPVESIYVNGSNIFIYDGKLVNQYQILR